MTGRHLAAGNGPIRSHRRRRPPLWMPLWIPALMVLLGAPIVVLSIVPSASSPGRLSVRPPIHATPGMQFTVGPVLSDPALGGPDDGQQTGDGAANFAATGSNPPAPAGQPMPAPAAGNAPQPATSLPSSPSPSPASTNPQAKPHPTPDCPPSGHPGRGKKSPKPQEPQGGGA